jgi:hypothetical protein
LEYRIANVASAATESARKKKPAEGPLAEELRWFEQLSCDTVSVSLVTSDLAQEWPNIEAAVFWHWSLFADDLRDGHHQRIEVFLVRRNWSAEEISAVAPLVELRTNTDFDFVRVVAEAEVLGRGIALSVIRNAELELGAFRFQKPFEGHSYWFAFCHMSIFRS